MNVRMKDNPSLVFYSGQFNTHALGEVKGCHDDFGVDLFFIRELDVYIRAKIFNGFFTIAVGWKDMSQAFKDHDIIIDNYNTCFFEPKNKEDKKRGFTLN